MVAHGHLPIDSQWLIWVPDEIKVMTAAYEGALVDLNVANRDDPITDLIAKAIVNVTATGERDPILVKERAINALGVRRSTAA